MILYVYDQSFEKSAVNIYCVFQIFIIQGMSRWSSRPADSNFIVRYLHLHALYEIFELAFFSNNSDKPFQFHQPRFQLFRPIPSNYKDPNDRYRLFKNMLTNYRWQLSIGVLLTVIYASMNLLLSQIIKEFLQAIHDHTKAVSRDVIVKFIILQMLRMIFGLHMKRIFQQVAIQVQSSIARKLIKKALLMDSETRRKIPDSQIFQLENVDLKIIYGLFRVLYLAIQIPFTITIAIIWLFKLGSGLGIIAVYWVVVVFLIQRSLDDRMHKCNLTKLRLIGERSKLNYEFMQGIQLAKIIRYQSLLVQKNNDFFLHQNHDHVQFYRYSTLYDIAQLLLPIAVVLTAVLFDQNSQKPLTVHKLYLILSMLGICYRPMKDIRTLNIAFGDGTHSLQRMSNFLDLPQNEMVNILYLKNSRSPGQIVIENGTTGTVEGKGVSFDITCKFQIQLKPGDRLVVLGRVGQGASSFLNMVAGNVFVKNGHLRVQGRIAYLSDSHFFLFDSIFKNLTFYSDHASYYDVDRISKQLGLKDELCLSGLQEIVDENKYNENQLKFIAIARIFCSMADILILDSPFTGLGQDHVLRIEKMLRSRQQEGAIVILSLKTTQFVKDEDKVVILSAARTKQYGLFKELVHNPRSSIDNFIKAKEGQREIQNEELRFVEIVKKFQYKVRKAVLHQMLFKSTVIKQLQKKKIVFLNKTIAAYSRTLLNQQRAQKEKEEKQKSTTHIHLYFSKFLHACSFFESIYILVIIIAVEFLHIFIHFYIGHELEHRAKEGIKSVRTLMLYEVILTIGLAGLIYLQGQVSSHLSVIAGNKLYKESLQSLVHKPLKWYGESYFLQIADKFNHDYEEVFIQVHAILNLFEYMVILVATALIVGGNHQLILLTSIFVALFYYWLLKLLRRAHFQILKYYYDYKYQFVKVFNESIQGSQMIRVFGVVDAVIDKGKDRYNKLASYKAAINNVNLAQTILCDLASTVITAAALQFTLRMRTSGDISFLATSLMLLLNLETVFNHMVQTAISSETIFRINILPFMQVAPQQIKSYHQDYPKPPTGYDVKFQNVILMNRDEPIFEIYPLNLQIKEGEHLCIYENDEWLRGNILNGLTKNIIDLSFPNERNKRNNIFFGGVPICQISSQTLRSLIGVIQNENFLLSGTLRQHLKWRNKHFKQQHILQIAMNLGIDHQIPDFQVNGLDANIAYGRQQQSRHLNKKLAVLRVLTRKPKVVILKDTTPFIDSLSIVDLLKKYNPGCTIIKITNTLEVAYDVSRIIYLEKLKLLEEGVPNKLIRDNFSKIGELLRECNEQMYIFRNRKAMVKDDQRASKKDPRKSQRQIPITSTKKD